MAAEINKRYGSDKISILHKVGSIKLLLSIEYCSRKVTARQS